MSERKKKWDRLAFVGSLAGGLAHEIKNPLSTISVNLQLMKEDWEKIDGARDRRTLKRIEILASEINRLEGILNDFLTYAKGFSLKPSPQSLNRIVNELVLFLDPEARKRGVELRFNPDPALPEVLVDVKYIKLALMNILQNALQALEPSRGEEGGEILVRTRSVDGGVEVVITDTGSGISGKHRDKIFQVYYSTKSGGTGLGLPMVKRIIEEHNGSVSFQSEEGKGTSFTVFVPKSEFEDRRPGEKS